MAADPADDSPEDDAGPGLGGHGGGGRDVAKPARGLRGRVLVAGRHLRDRNFFRTLVLLIEHGAEGAMGLIVNRPTDARVRDALAGHFDLPDGAPAGAAAVYAGGPVEPNALFVLHDSPAHADGERSLVRGKGPKLYAGHSREAFEGLVEDAAGADGDDPDAPRVRYRIFAGGRGVGAGAVGGRTGPRRLAAGPRPGGAARRGGPGGPGLRREPLRRLARRRRQTRRRRLPRRRRRLPVELKSDRFTRRGRSRR